uniref:TLK2 n=1 Tax=Arundo donax TaxID=35708 RepID=A0A0A9D382_ARUDO
MRASSLASLDEDGLEFDERCCTMSSPDADEPDIASDCSQTGSPAPKLPEEATQTARASRFLPHRGARAHEPPGGWIYPCNLVVRVRTTAEGELRRSWRCERDGRVAIGSKRSEQ